MRISRIRLSRRLSPRGIDEIPKCDFGSRLAFKASFRLGAASSAVIECFNRHASRLTKTHRRRGPFAPRELPRVPATMDLSDFRRSRPAVMSSRRALRPSPQPRRISQVPRPICPRALSPITPASPVGSMARCAPHRRRASPHPKGWPTRRKCYEGESGSHALRLTRSLGGASTRQSPERAARVATC